MGLLPEKHVYSYSQLSSVDECAYGFYLRRIEGIEEPATNAFAERGSLIHDLLDMWAKKILTKEEMLQEYERRYGDEVVTAWPSFPKGQAQKAYEKGIEFLTNFDEFEGYEVIAAEKKFQLELPLPDGTTRPFIGIIDLLLKEKKTNNLIICDHKSKSLQSFKKDEDKMYRQQLLYASYIKEQYNQWPDSLMFNLMNENGLRMERFFSMEQYDEAIGWASKQIRKIEDNDILDWLICKEKPDYFCWELCDARKVCPSGVKPDFRKKRQTDDFNDFKE